MSYPVYNQSGSVVKEVNLNPAVFDVKINPELVHQTAVAQMANARPVLAHTKTKDEVRGGGKKPWRQKGTGRARHGSSRSPLWVGGGVTFGPRNTRNFSQKINKKMKCQALFSCLTDRAKDQALILVDELNLPEWKTKNFTQLILNLKDALRLSSAKTKSSADDDEKKTKKSTTTRKEDLKNYRLSLLVVAGANTKSVSRVARNIPGVKVLGANSLNVIDILDAKNLLLSEDSLSVIEKTYLH
ncbi:50S ribosomal protein L4 [Candidatus Kuenenbacteria bacterium]|nr:50S ribosomal protein L4 [Candidatus Kuenenbacteria bacterium]